MLSFIYSKKYRILLHITFWISFILFYTLQSFLYYYDISMFPNLMTRWLISAPLFILATYFNLYYVIPKFLLKKRYLKFAVVSAISALIFLFLERLLIYYITSPLLYEKSSFDAMRESGFLSVGPIFSFFSYIYLIVAVASSIKLFKQWYLDQQAHQQFVKEKLESEINFLKSQIHPHFLFNLLNNLYALTLKKSDKAPEMILKLSSLLDYMLYQSNSQTVPLEKEINLLNDYIGLEKLRYGSRLQINFYTEGSISDIHLSPLLLFPFVENAFKHGASNELGETWVNINLAVNSEKIIFEVENKKSRLRPNKKVGIGLKNVKRRLELLYNSEFTLDISDIENKYSVKLILPANRGKE